jgi:PAS domain S-box-containing protein
MQTSTRDTSSGFRPANPGKDPVWSALTDDTDLPVAVVDSAGVFEFVNAAAARQMNVDAAAAVGHNLREYFSEDFVNERMSIIRQVITAGRPVTIEGMVKGRLRRTVYRPLAVAGQPTRVLMVSRLAATSAAASVPGQEDNGVVQSRANEAGKLASLTAREMEILKLIGIGLSTADIAKKLGRSVKTVEWHRVSLGDKLGVTNRVELARIAIAAGLVSLDEPGKKGEATSDN